MKVHVRCRHCSKRVHTEPLTKSYNSDKIKEKMYSMAGTFFLISETLVDESKRHISSEEAIGKIRELMRMNDIPCSCFAVDKMLEEIRDTL